MKASALALLALVVPMTGCSTVELPPSQDQATTVSVCTIAERPQAYLQKITRMRARYYVVKNYDSFFSGVDCVGKSGLGEGSRRDSDKSVTKFLAAGDQLCKSRKIESLCTLEADVVVDVRVRVSGDGEYVADLIHVKSFNYLPEKPARE